MSVKMPSNDEIARVAHAIWEAEGRPEGRDHDHWMRAKHLIAEGRAEAEFPEVAADRAEPEPASRPVQPGFEDVPPGIVPKMMKHDAGSDLREEPGGRFAKQIAELPAGPPETGPAESETPGPRNPAPMPPANAEGFVSIPSNDESAGRALSDDPVAPPSGEGQRGARRKGSRPLAT